MRKNLTISLETGIRGARCQQSGNDHARFSSGSNFHFPRLGDVEQNNPVSSETKRNNERGEREREGKKKRKQALFHSSIQKITLIREEEHSPTLSNPKDRNRSRNGGERRRRMVEIQGENLFALEIISWSFHGIFLGGWILRPSDFIMYNTRTGRDTGEIKKEATIYGGTRVDKTAGFRCSEKRAAGCGGFPANARFYVSSS